MLTCKHTKELGFRERRCGTKYLRDAVNYILSQPEDKPVVLVREVYSAVAEKYGKSWSAVERAIRNTIDQCESDEFYGTAKDTIMELVERYREGEFE